MTPLILKRAPIGPHQEEYDVLEDGRCRRLHLSHAHWTEGPPLDVDDPRQQGVLTDARLRADARGRDGSVRQELATVSELCSLDWDTLGTGLVVGWRWSPWCRACSPSSTASTGIAGGLSMSRLSEALLRVG
jgi:hypothetical protein